jgi:cupin 2 domain-containing protein
MTAASSVGKMKNVFSDIPADLPDEQCQTLLTTPHFRIERIVSRGHSSPPGFWYDQDQHEWVLLIKGAARLRFEDELIEMKPGDFVNIPAHRKHRVEWTTPEENTIWRQMDANTTTTIGLLNQTATSLGQSFANYWPADDKNDPVERNVSLHFAHAMLSTGFSAFAEADHPERRTILGIDVFGLAPDNAWFLGCEFNRLYNAETLMSLANDMQRLSSFRPRIAYSSSMYGPTFAVAASCCKGGYGLVGGLHWVSGGKQSSLIRNREWNDILGAAVKL